MYVLGKKVKKKDGLDYITEKNRGHDMTAYEETKMFFFLFTSASDPARAIRGGIPPSCPIAMLIERPKVIIKVISK